MTAPLLIQILKMIFFVLVGFTLRKTGKMTEDQSKGFSIACIYAIIPCTILLGFQRDITPEISGSLIKCEEAILLIHCLMMIIYTVLRRVCRFSPVESVSMVYPNSGNMIIPIIMAILGNDYLIYSGLYMTTQVVFMWSHGYSVIAGETRISLKTIFSNSAMISCIAGFIMFFLQIKMSPEVYDLCNLAGSMTAPLSMLTAGVLLGELKIEDLKSYTRLPLMVVTRLVVIPLIIIALLKVFSITLFSSLAPEIFVVLFLSTVAPPASTLVQIAQVFTDDARYVSCINSICMICCAVTMPIVMAVFEKFM